MLPRLVGNGAAVDHVDHDEVALRDIDRDLDAPARRGAHRVVEEVRERAADRRGIAAQPIAPSAGTRGGGRQR